MLQHEKTFTLEDGSKLRVVVSLEAPAVSLAEVPIAQQAYYSVWVETKPKGARTWSPVVNKDAFAYRKMSKEERAQLKLKACLSVAGAQRIQSVADELWQAIKPDVTRNFS